MKRMRIIIALAMTLGLSAGAGAQSFVNWESPQVNPLDMTPDGTRLLVANTADDRLEIFAISAGGALTWQASVPVGLDPVSVRARTNGEAWVVNHISDSISIVDLDALEVVATLNTGDEPADVIFAGTAGRAFVTVSQLDEVKVYDPNDLAAAPSVLAIAGEDPRALATDGTTVYAAIFESGNRTTIIPADDVSNPSINPYPGAPNPPPNAPGGFTPPIAPGLPTPPPVSLIVRKSGGQWIDHQGANWSAGVTWDLLDHDVAVIDADTLGVSYITGLMNADMNLAVRPNGDLLVVGTEALNKIPFESNLRGIFVVVTGAYVPHGAATASNAVDLNPHLDYTTGTVPQNVRDQSIGDPRGIAWNAAGDRAYIAGMGSNNVIVVDANLNRLGRVDVGQGPTAVRVDAANGVLYVLDRFEGSVSAVDTGGLVEVQRAPFFDPTPAVIKVGRPHLYDTHATSGLGQAACASCHIDARMDQLAWNLGDPQGTVKPFNQVCNLGMIGGCEDWHPMKGPMMTQSLVGAVGTEPLHWRGDREDLMAFNSAFQTLMGDDEQLTVDQMTEFQGFLATLRYPPNPNRNIDNSLKTSLPTGGDPVVGASLFNTVTLGLFRCNQCHTPPTGTSGSVISANTLFSSQSMKAAQLRNLYEKTGFLRTSMTNTRGFGFTHDGAFDTIVDFLQLPSFHFTPGPTGDTQRKDVEAFLLSFATDTHAGVGVQATMGGPLDQTALRDQMISLADGGLVGLVARGVVDGAHRGYAYLDSGTFQSDRAAEQVTAAQLDAAAAAGHPITYTLVPTGTQTRIGIDRDEDGYLDGDEADACSDPADAQSTPLNAVCPGQCPADVTGPGDQPDGNVDALDFLALIGEWGTSCAGGCTADVTGPGGAPDGVVDALDYLLLIGQWGTPANCP
jgi:YVTN family beta-propeller protein